MTEPVHTYPSNRGPGSSWALDLAWKILDAVPPGVISHGHRAYLAGAIAATLMRQAKRKAQPGEEDTR